MTFLRPFVSALFLAAVSAALASDARSQSSCLAWDSSLGLPGGISGTIRALAAFDDGAGPALFVAGQFGAAGDVAVGSIAKWDGAQWSALGGGIGEFGAVSALAVFDDGQGPALHAAGAFDSIGGVEASSIARWNGTSWTALASGVEGSVHALVVFDAGNGPALYAAGEFTHAGGANARNVARWNGTSWSALGTGFDGDVHSLAVHDDGFGPKLYAGGTFTHAGLVLVNGIARWDGAGWSALSDGVVDGVTGGSVTSLATYDGGNGAFLIVGGSFTRAGGTLVANVARWNGSTWLALGSGVDGAVEALAVYDAGDGPDLFAGGSFAFAGGMRVDSIARWNGIAWSDLAGGANAPVTALGVFDVGDGARLAAGGIFSRAGDVPANRIAQWDGHRWGTIDGARNAGPVLALASLDAGGGPVLYTSSGYASSIGPDATVVMKLEDGIWAALGGGSDDEAKTFAHYDDGNGTRLYTAGRFVRIGTTFLNRVARWSGTAWEPLGGGANADVHALVAFDDGTGSALYAGGSFTSAGGVPASFVARWNGASWSPVGAGFDAPVFALAVFNDGSGPALYAAGQFLSSGGSPALRVARWNGTSWSPLGGGIGAQGFGGGTVSALAVANAGGSPALYAGGSFFQASGAGASNVARWNGSSWLPLGLGVSSQVLALAAFDDGAGEALFAGGLFVSAGGKVVNQVARWNGASWSALAGGVNANVFALAAHDDGSEQGRDLYVGGLFTSAGGVTSRFLARWDGCAGPETLFCAGDGSVAACPCANSGAATRGCANSSGAAGALLSAIGATSPDTIVLTASGEPTTAASIFLQGTSAGAPVAFGDGLRCIGGSLKRLYVRTAVGGNVTAPIAGEPSITAQSAALGDPIAPGTTRYYQTHYRDGPASFCPPPLGSSFNVTNGVKIVW